MDKSIKTLTKNVEMFVKYYGLCHGKAPAFLPLIGKWKETGQTYLEDKPPP